MQGESEEMPCVDYDACESILREMLDDEAVPAYYLEDILGALNA